MLNITITRADGELLETIDFAALRHDLHMETGATGSKLDAECLEWVRQRVLMALLSERRMEQVNAKIFG
jgi:hypothetical protein